jgi:hypothetical protein
MAFAKADDEEEIEALREALASELAEDEVAPAPLEAEADDEPAARRFRLPIKTVVKGAALVALVVGAYLVIDRWASPPAAQPLADLEVRLDAEGYWIDGVKISELVDGAPVFFERADFGGRGAVPGSTSILFDGHAAPGATAGHFRRELEARGFSVAAVQAAEVVDFAVRQQAAAASED